MNAEKLMNNKNNQQANQMSRYTFVMNYNEGTYISQVEGKDEHHAIRVWLQQLDTNPIAYFTERQKQRLIQEDFEDQGPVLIQGCTNVWCICLRVLPNKSLALIHFVKTSK